MPRNYLKEETLLFKRFRTFSPLHIFSFKNCFDRVARWKNTCFFHRAAISTANTTRTRIRRLMEGSAPARRCSFPRWCTVPVACCSKTPETGDTATRSLPCFRRGHVIAHKPAWLFSWWIGKNRHESAETSSFYHDENQSAGIFFS